MTPTQDLAKVIAIRRIEYRETLKVTRGESTIPEVIEEVPSTVEWIVNAGKLVASDGADTSEEEKKEGDGDESDDEGEHAAGE
jgi:hypothetical protein